MSGKYLGACIYLSWGVMMTLLVKREVLDFYGGDRPLSYRNLLYGKELPRRKQMGIYLLDHRIGVSRTLITREQDHTYRVHHQTELNPQSDVKGFLVIESTATIDAAYELKRIEMQVDMQGQRVRIDGIVQGDSMHMYSGETNNRRHRVVPFQSNYTLSEGFSPFMAIPHLGVGREWNFASLDPRSGAMTRARAVVMELTKIRHLEEEVEVFLVQVEQPGATYQMWVTPEGEIVRQTTFLPLPVVLQAERWSEDREWGVGRE